MATLSVSAFTISSIFARCRGREGKRECEPMRVQVVGQTPIR